MDWKNKWTEVCGHAKKFWAVFMSACGKAWELSKETWGKTKVWLRKVWNKSNIWLTKAWRILKICLDKLNLWLGAAWDFLSVKGRRAAGKLAVIALKLRKWVLKKTARLRGWWAQSKGRAWLAEKCAAIREKMPRPAEKPAIEEASEEFEEEWEETIEEEIPLRRGPAPRKHGKVVTVLLKIWKIFSSCCVWIYNVRKYIMAIPVAYYAVKLAIANSNRLPEMVGLDIQASGEFARMVSRQNAVLGPLGITLFCLVLLLCSKKPLLPWLISAFTLILPILIWMTNYYA
ncbi:MAG: hypothetical protein IKY17_05600 [Oscillospiraceae bacterium]|nr:hypothetical protein [Oscillospiraceae bacterium]